MYRTDNMFHVQRTRRANINLNKNGGKRSVDSKIKFGIKIPRNIKEALLFDKESKNNKWIEAVNKEMNALKKLKCFKFHPPGTKFGKAQGWQYAPLHMIKTTRHAVQS